MLKMKGSAMKMSGRQWIDISLRSIVLLVVQDRYGKGPGCFLSRCVCDIVYLPCLFPRLFLSFCNSFSLYLFIHSFIHSGYFCSASSSSLLLKGAPDTARTLCRSFKPMRHRQLRVKDLLRFLRGG